MIDKEDPAVKRDVPFDGVGLEYIFVEKRIYTELIISRPIDDRFSGVKWNLLMQRLLHIDDRAYDMLEFDVFALQESDWTMLKEVWEGQDGYCSPTFDIERHLKIHNALTVKYTATYWFDITSFFGK